MRWWLGALGLLAVALVLRLEYVAYALYAFLGVLGLSRYAARRWTEWLVVTRSCSAESAEIGERATVTVRIRNAGGGRIPWLLLEEGLPQSAVRQHPPRLRTTAPALEMVSMRAGEVRELKYEVEFRMRGYYGFGPVLVEGGDLFGLHRRYRVVSDPCFVLVRPQVVPLLGYDLASRRPVGEVRLRHRLMEDPTRIAGVRAYEAGDPLNRIHWGATARTGVLHSKVHDPSCVAGSTLVLDFRSDRFPSRRPAAASAELARRLRAAGQADEVAGFEGPSPAAVELAATTAASLAQAIHLMGQKVGLASNGRDAAERIRTEGMGRSFRSRAVARRRLAEGGVRERLEPVLVETRRDAGQLDRILDTLARLEPSDGLPLAELLAEVRPRMPRDATVAVVLAGVDEAAAVALGGLRRSGFAVTALVVDPGADELHDWAGAPEWALRLTAEGVDFRLIRDEAGLERLCAEQFVR